MKINIIVAHDLNRGIGIDNDLPWRMPSDLMHFKKMTMGGLLVFGRNTFESIPGFLPGRTVWVLSRKGAKTLEHTFSSPEEVLKKAKEMNLDEIWIAGGSQIYSLFMGHATDLWITVIEASVQATVHFPEWNKDEFEMVSSKKGIRTEKDEYDFHIEHWKRAV